MIEHALPAASRTALAVYFSAPAVVVSLWYVADVTVAKCIVAAIVRWKHGVANRERLVPGIRRPIADDRCTHSVTADIAPGIAA